MVRIHDDQVERKALESNLRRERSPLAHIGSWLGHAALTPFMPLIVRRDHRMERKYAAAEADLLSCLDERARSAGSTVLPMQHVTEATSLHGNYVMARGDQQPSLTLRVRDTTPQFGDTLLGEGMLIVSEAGNTEIYTELSENPLNPLAFRSDAARYLGLTARLIENAYPLPQTPAEQ